MSELTVHDIFNAARELKTNELINTNGLVLVYYTNPVRHRKLNEELHYRFKKNESELEYHEIIEVNISGIDVQIKVEAEDE
jgi:hypothetical protein